MKLLLPRNVDVSCQDRDRRQAHVSQRETCYSGDVVALNLHIVNTGERQGCDRFEVGKEQPPLLFFLNDDGQCASRGLMDFSLRGAGRVPLLLQLVTEMG